MSVKKDEDANDEEVLFDVAAADAGGDAEFEVQLPAEAPTSSCYWMQALGPVDNDFDASGCAKEISRCYASGAVSSRFGRSDGSGTGIEPRLRRVLWARWLGVLQGASPRSWLAEMRTLRSRFEALLQDAEARNDRAAWQLRSTIDLDVMRCFPEIPRFQTAEARGALRQVLLAYTEHLRQSQNSQSGKSTADLCYRQGFHELAAVVLWICWDGSWSLDEEGPTQQNSETDADSDEAVFAEIGSPSAVIADATAIFYALLHRTHLADLFEPTGVGEVTRRSRGIMEKLHQIDPDLSREVSRWGIEPHVLFLRWFRLLFIRELQFPEHALAAWDALFAEAAANNRLEQQEPLLLTDFLALAMVLDARPEAPERLLRYGEYPSNVLHLLALAHSLQMSGSDLDRSTQAASDRASSSRARTSGVNASVSAATSSVSKAFPMPPPPRLSDTSHLRPNAGMMAAPALSGAETRFGVHAMPAYDSIGSGAPQSTFGENPGGSIFGRALGWAASQLEVVRDAAKGAMQDVPSATLAAPRRPPGFAPEHAPAVRLSGRGTAESAGFDGDVSETQSDDAVQAPDNESTAYLRKDLRSEPGETVKHDAMEQPLQSNANQPTSNEQGDSLEDRLSLIRNAVAGLQDHQHLQKPSMPTGDSVKASSTDATLQEQQARVSNANKHHIASSSAHNLGRASDSNQSDSQSKRQAPSFTHKVPHRKEPASKGTFNAPGDGRHMRQAPASSGYPQAVPSNLPEWTGLGAAPAFAGERLSGEASQSERLPRSEDWEEAETRPNREAVGNAVSSTASVLLAPEDLEMESHGAVDLKGYRRLHHSAAQMSYDGAFDAKGFSAQQPEAWYQSASPQWHPGPQMPAMEAATPDHSSYAGYEQQAAMSGRLADAIQRLERGDGPRETVLQELRAIQAQLHWDASMRSSGGPTMR